MRGIKTTPLPPSSTFYFLKFSFTYFAKFPYLGGSVGCGWNFLLASAFSSLNFQPLNGFNFWTTCLIWINKPSLESYCVVVFKYYAFEHVLCDVFADVSSFSLISGKIRHVALINLIWRYIARFSKKARQEMFRVFWNMLRLIFVFFWIIFE